jgi:hypothetical protein
MKLGQIILGTELWLSLTYTMSRKKYLFKQLNTKTNKYGQSKDFGTNKKYFFRWLMYLFNLALTPEKTFYQKWNGFPSQNCLSGQLYKIYVISRFCLTASMYIRTCRNYNIKCRRRNSPASMKVLLTSWVHEYIFYVANYLLTL